MKIPHIERLRELFDYDESSGLLYWRAKTNRRTVVGSVAGCADGRGYVKVGVDGCKLQAHRVVWAYCTGAWPEREIDHIDGDRSNNRIANLRDVSASVNRQNQRSPQKRNKVGLLGVSRKRNRFRSAIEIDGAHVALGSYATKEQAHAAYLEAKRKLHQGCTL